MNFKTLQTDKIKLPMRLNLFRNVSKFLWIRLQKNRFQQRQQKAGTQWPNQNILFCHHRGEVVFILAIEMWPKMVKSVPDGMMILFITQKNQSNCFLKHIKCRWITTFAGFNEIQPYSPRSRLVNTCEIAYDSSKKTNVGILLHKW